MLLRWASMADEDLDHGSSARDVSQSTNWSGVGRPRELRRQQALTQSSTCPLVPKDGISIVLITRSASTASRRLALFLDVGLSNGTCSFSGRCKYQKHGSRLWSTTTSRETASLHGSRVSLEPRPARAVFVSVLEKTGFSNERGKVSLSSNIRYYLLPDLEIAVNEPVMMKHEDLKLLSRVNSR
jgi:hypothetical protein